MKILLRTFVVAWSFLLMGFQVAYFGPDIASYYEEYKTPLPKRNKITFCTRDGCMAHREYIYTRDDLTQLHQLFYAAISATTEREAIGKSVVWMESKLGKSPGECIAETTNVTSHLLILEANGMLKFHSVVRPAGKWSWFVWPHWAGRMRDMESRVYWSVDTFFRKPGEFPQIVRFNDWYLTS